MYLVCLYCRKRPTSLFMWGFTGSFPLTLGLSSGGTAMGCMAMSWILLGSLLLASMERDIRSTCSKMDAVVEDGCSEPLIGGGPVGRRKTGREREGKRERERRQR